MTGAAGFLDFFVLEASDYVEQLDGLLLQGGSNGPDGESIQRVARALRGSATMAALPGFADVAGAVERVGRALVDGTVHWDPGLGSALVSAIDDLKILLHDARNWTAANDARATAAVAELTRYAPMAAAPAPTPVAASGVTYFATEAANIAAGLELLTTRPDDRDTAIQVLKRARALRGVAGIREVPGLADVLDAVDESAQGLEGASGVLGAGAAGVLRSAAVLLRRIAAALRDGTPLGVDAPEQRDFAAEVERWFEAESEAQPIVPIEDLYFADEGPHVVEGGSAPSSSGERLRLELTSLGEHVAGVIESLRGRPDESVERARRDLRRALRGVTRTAESFGVREIAERARELGDAVRQSASLDLESLGSLASQLVRGMVSPPERSPERSPERPQEAAPVPSPAPTSAAPPPRAGHDLDSAIAALSALDTHALAEPRPMPIETVVPIESLLYRGRDAIERARAIRDSLRGNAAEGSGDLEELYDLLDLALTD